MHVYHAADAANLDSLKDHGLKSGSYVTCSYDQALYYAETTTDEGKSVVILEMELDDDVAHVGEHNLALDHASIAEPIASTLDILEETVIGAWTDSNQTWRDSLDVV